MPPENNRARRNLRTESSTRYRNKWAVGIFKDWQRVRSVEFPILEVGGVFNDMNCTKSNRLLCPQQTWTYLTLNYWLSKFVQEMAKSSKYPYPPKTLYQIVCGIRRFVVEKNPAIELILWTLQTQGESVPRKVEKGSQNVDMDTMPVYFGDFKKYT